MSESTLRPEASPTLPVSSPTGDEVRAGPIVDPVSYELGAEIARGGMGRIVAARDLRLRRAVAIKVLLEPTPELAARFAREASITARLQHPAIVPVHETGRLPSGEPFYAMKLVEGRSLDAEIADRPALADRMKLIPNAIAVVDALAYAHAQHIIHRDLKPANVLVGAFGETVVIDWGLARALDEPDAHGAVATDAKPGLTSAGAVVGTPAFMSPEQAQGDRVDERTDVYALGALLYHIISGAPPFRGTSANVIAQLLDGPPTPIGELVPRVPSDLAALVTKAMARDPRERYPSARELATDLERFATGQLVAAYHYSPAQRITRAVRRNWQLFAAGAVALVLIAVIATFSVRRIVDERAEASRQRDTAHATSLTLLEEEGRTELRANHARRALAYLAAAYRERPDRTALRQLVAQASAPIAPALHVLRGHRAALTAIEMSSDGARIVTASKDNTARLWDADGNPLATLQHSGAVNVARFNPDGTRLVTGSADTFARVWDSRSGKLIVEHEHAASVSDVAWSPDGKRVLSATDRGQVALWDATTGETLVRSAAHARALLSYGASSFTPDGSRFVVADVSDMTSTVWDVATAKPAFAVHCEMDFCRRAALAAKGNRLVTVDKAMVRLWDAATGAPLAPIDQPFAEGAGFAVSRDGRWIAITHALATSAEIYDAVTGQLRATLPGEGLIASVAFGTTGTLVATPRPAGADLRDAATGQIVATYEGHDGSVTAVALGLDDTRVLTASADGTARIWDATVRTAKVVDLRPSKILAIGNDGRRVIAVSDAGARVVDGDVTAAIGGPAEGAALSPDGTRAALWAGRELRLVDATTGRELARTNDTAEQIVMATFSPHGDRVATIGWDGCRVLDASTGHELARLSIPVHPDVARFGQGSFAGYVTFDAGGRRVALALYGRRANQQPAGLIEVWDPSRAALEVTIDAGDALPTSVRFSPDGERVLVGNRDQSAAVWDLATKRRLARFEGHAGYVNDVGYSRDGARVVTASGDRTVRVWDAETGAQLAMLPTTASVVRARFQADGDHVAVMLDDFTARIWDVHLERRTPSVFDALVTSAVGWRLVDGRLVDPTK